MMQRETIFIVDDVRTNLEIVEAILCDEYTIYKAMSGKEMFSLLEKETIPDLILLDISMPEMDGYAVNKKLKSNDETEYIPVIFMTASEDKESEARALREGAVDYITKPFSPDVLKMRISLHMLLQRQNKELLESAQAYEVANNAKTAFITVMSHELRTPLNAILGFSELSLEADGLSEELYSNLINIKNAGSTLLDLVNDILDLSKINTGTFDFIPAEYDTAYLIWNAMNQSIIYRSDKPIEFSISIDERLPARLFGDERRVKQVLANLLTNAFKYTSEGKVELAIGCVFEKDGVIWTTAIIKDTGIGILPEDYESIFEEYVQTDMTTHRDIAGTGLGLPVARKLARMMHGDIEVTSEYGKGSTFSVRIKQQMVSDADEIIGEEVIRGLRNFRFSEQQTTTTKSKPLLWLPYVRILVVDDVDVNLAVAVGLLKRYGIKTDCVTSGIEAVKAVKEQNVHYNAIFMDHMMPGIDGVETTRIIRKINTPYAKNIPIIAFTANAIVGTKEMFLENGFQDFISKPIELSRLDCIIRNWVWDKNEGAVKPKAEHGNDDFNEAGWVTISAFHVSGVDFNKGLERFDGDADTYMNVMRSFAQNVPIILEKVVTVPEGNLKEYTTTVHGIKGSCYGICAEETGALAEALESAAKEEDYDYLNANNHAFVESTRKLLSDIAELFAHVSPEKQAKQQPDPELLKQLLEACNRHDMNEIDSIAAELDAYTYETDGDLVTWLREMADEMNYSDMAERLAQFSQ